MKYYYDLQEGVYDPNIFKAFFLAGGPGSGKSEVVRRTTGGLGLKIVNSDDYFEKLLKRAGLSLKMPPEEEVPRDIKRLKAKELTKLRKENYLEGRLGLVIDGTGHDAAKLIRQSIALQELGYDTHMIFVNTSQDVALQRNAERSRSVPESIVINSWKNVQANIGTFSQHFGGGRFIVIDNNDPKEKMQKDIFPKIWKIIKKLTKKKVNNTRAQNWIKMELAKKRR